MALRIPDGEGVINPKAPAGRVIAFYATLLIMGALGSLGGLTFLGVITVGGPARGEEPHKMPSGVAQQVEQIASDVRDIKAEQSNQSRDIAVIKRQLGLDGLGPPVRTSGPSR